MTAIYIIDNVNTCDCRMEQAEYSREGVAVDVITVSNHGKHYYYLLLAHAQLICCYMLTAAQYIDNSQTLDLLEARRGGLLSMIDEEINVPKGTDETLLNKIFKMHEKLPNLRRYGGTDSE